MQREVSESDMYMQIAYYRWLFDVARAKSNLAAENKRAATDAAMYASNALLPTWHANATAARTIVEATQSNT